MGYSPQACRLSVTTAKLDAGAVVTSKIGDAQVTAAKLATRTRTSVILPWHPNSHTRLTDNINCSLGLELSYTLGAIPYPGYQFQNNNVAGSGLKSGFISTMSYLPEDLLSVNVVKFKYGVTGPTAQVFARFYDNGGGLIKTAGPFTGGGMSTTPDITSWPAGAEAESRFYTVFECIAGPGDSVKIYELVMQVSYQ